MRHFPPLQPRNPSGAWSANRDRTEQARFRRAVLTNAGHQCQHVEHGHRCPTTNPLQAHHTHPGNNDPATGLALCHAHHKQLDPHAR